VSAQPAGRRLLAQLADGLQPFGFRRVDDSGAAGELGVALLLKRQTWNTNRAVVVVDAPSLPSDFGAFLRRVRTHVAFRAGFFPLLWGIGIQVIVVTSDVASRSLQPARYVAAIDNQWAIVQSVFIVNADAAEFSEGRTWGQFVTGKFQDAISNVLSLEFRRTEPEVQ
jgi:hypothetical protein